VSDKHGNQCASNDLRRSVELNADEDVEWIWTHTADGKSVVTGYLITKRADEPRQRRKVLDASTSTSSR
jgi:hypothetical protein